MLDEIAELASGGGETAQALADATIKRLGNKSPIVKQKVKVAKTKANVFFTYLLRYVMAYRLLD